MDYREPPALPAPSPLILEGESRVADNVEFVNVPLNDPKKPYPMDQIKEGDDIYLSFPDDTYYYFRVIRYDEASGETLLSYAKSNVLWTGLVDDTVFLANQSLMNGDKIQYRMIGEEGLFGPEMTRRHDVELVCISHRNPMPIARINHREPKYFDPEKDIAALKLKLPDDYRYFIKCRRCYKPRANMYQRGDIALQEINFEEPWRIKKFPSHFLGIGYASTGRLAMSLSPDDFGNIYLLQRDQPVNLLRPRYLGGKRLEQIDIQGDKPPLIASSFSEFVLGLTDRLDTKTMVLTRT